MWLIQRETFDEFIKKVLVEGKRHVTKTDIDRVAKKSRDTREDLEAGRGNARSHSAFTRVLQMDASTFLAELAKS